MNCYKTECTFQNKRTNECEGWGDGMCEERKAKEGTFDYDAFDKYRQQRHDSKLLSPAEKIKAIEEMGVPVDKCFIHEPINSPHAHFEGFTLREFLMEGQ